MSSAGLVDENILTMPAKGMRLSNMELKSPGSASSSSSWFPRDRFLRFFLPSAASARRIS